MSTVFMEDTWSRVLRILKDGQFSMDLTFADARHPNGYALKFTHPTHYPVFCYNKKQSAITKNQILIEFEWDNPTWGRQPAYEFAIREPEEGEPGTGKRISTLQTAYVNPLRWSTEEQFWQLLTWCVEKGANCPELQQRPRQHENIK